jgi:hypothetical protein
MQRTVSMAETLHRPCSAGPFSPEGALPINARFRGENRFSA